MKMYGKYLSKLKEKRPLIHCLTNYVTVNDVANAVLALGASPVMSDHPSEAADISSLADGVLINTGTLSDTRFEAMKTAGRNANILGKPVVLDPVGAGSSKHRTASALSLISGIHFDAVRGNISELKTLASGHAKSRGVDADLEEIKRQSDTAYTAELACSFSKLTDSVVIISGESDTIAYRDEAYAVRNGSHLMRFVTGTGCMLSAVCAAFIASAPEEKLDACIAAVAAMGICAETAEERMMPGEGNISFRNHLIDALFNITEEDIDSKAKVDEVR